MHCDRSSSTCTHWNLRRGARWWKLLRRHVLPFCWHWTASRAVVQLPRPRGRMRCESYVYLADTPPSDISIFFRMESEARFVPVYGCIILIYCGVQPALKESSRWVVWVHQKGCFMLHRCLMGYTCGGGHSGFDVLTQTVPWEAAEKVGKKIKVILKAVTW